MSEKMRNCKACGQQIAQSANVCPHCGAKVKKGSPVLAVAVVIVILAIIIGATSGSDEPVKVEGNNSSQNQTNNNQADNNEQKETTDTNEQKETADKKEDNTFKVGETAELKKVAVSLVGVTESEGSSFNTPTDGNVFVLCEFEIANNSDEEITVSSMLSFNAYCDDYACTYSLGALMAKGDKNQLDGTVAAGKKFNGVIGYEVPADWKELEVRFTPDFWTGKEIVFVATNN